MRDRIYLDHAATTAVRPEALEAMLPFLTEACGNASSIHATGREARRALEAARRQIADALGAENREIYFTSGGSESDNWAIIGTARALQNRGRHMITSSVEHHAVLHACDFLEKNGFEITRVKTDGYGRVNPEEIRKALRSDTILVSVMTANNEIGTLEPVAEIAEMCRENGIRFHTDAVQAVGSVPVNVKETGVDLLSLSAHKFYGPKGAGALYIRSGVRMDPLIFGGAQEKSLRAGTENVPAIVGMGKALEAACREMPETAERITRLRKKLIHGILYAIPDARLLGDPENRLPGNCCFQFPGVEGEALLLRMDLQGIAASSGSACTSGSVDPSHVLKAIGLKDMEAKGSLRMTLGKENTEEEIDTVLHVLPEIVSDLRGLQLS